MIGSVTLFMTQGFERGWLSVFSVSCLVVFLISGIVFVLFERKRQCRLLIFHYLNTVHL